MIAFYALDLQSPAKFPILQAQFELVLFPSIKNRGTIQTSMWFLNAPSASRWSIFNSTDHWSSTRVQWQFACWGLTVHWANSSSFYRCWLRVDRQVTQSIAISISSHPLGKPTVWSIEGFASTLWTLTVFTCLACSLICFKSMSVFIGFWFTGNLAPFLKEGI